VAKRRKVKVPQDGAAARVHQDVLQLDVAVDYSRRVDRVKGEQEGEGELGVVRWWGERGCG
jgi:hypothetical protein